MLGKSLVILDLQKYPGEVSNGSTLVQLKFNQSLTKV